MVFVKVPEAKEAEMLKEFCNTSVFTFEGLDIKGKNGTDFKRKFEPIARSTGFKEKDLIAYTFNGKTMNKVYGLTGDNAYPDDLTFVCIPNYYSVAVKMQTGARWFDDIVDNNARRERGE